MYTFLNLRKPGDTGYKIPNGGGFSLISAPNYFGNHLIPHLKIKITILKTKIYYPFVFVNIMNELSIIKIMYSIYI